jgi:hypothetical protein
MIVHLIINLMLIIRLSSIKIKKYPHTDILLINILSYYYNKKVI